MLPNQGGSSPPQRVLAHAGRADRSQSGPLSAGSDNPRIRGAAGPGWLNGEIEGRPGDGIDWRGCDIGILHFGSAVCCS